MTNPSSAGQRTLTQPTVIAPFLQLLPLSEPFQPTNEHLAKTKFRHPGYADSENIILILPAFDSNGIHHETARIACCILANCAWDGYLSLSPNGPRVPPGPDFVLTAPAYYFCVPDDFKYAVVPSLEHFHFPNQLPRSWEDNNQAPILSASTGAETCCITCSSLPLETAHIIPAKNIDWWQDNLMYEYARQPSASMDTHCPDNSLRLRKDVHTLWDAHRFALVPKQGAWVAHVLEAGVTDELQALYHNLQLQPLAGVRREYMLARFAMAVLDKAMFARQPSKGLRRLVWIGTRGEDPGVKELSPKQCRAIFGVGARGKSSSRSPSKRARAEGDDDDENGPRVQDDNSDCCDYSEHESRMAADCSCLSLDGSDEGEEDEIERGRPRKRLRRDNVVEKLHSEPLLLHTPSFKMEARSCGSRGFGVSLIVSQQSGFDRRHNLPPYHPNDDGTITDLRNPERGEILR
ncbi:hypothetical protein B0T25DRAFT_276599 [Lasiosphaeria hispida]|uniref:HNH nuclease domain-containing protein n=1 Tax=Lasiosphaeria hispida TaxID=260671 RepID=A0AAJ0MAM0_9PEZI|nr:hypothetical protein B0T25DRAFT_276599 [Lasiosphaeria hispida]